MTAAVFDTSLVIDYLRGVKSAQEAFAEFPDHAITVGTWVEVMAAAPQRFEPQTREFLRGFERLAINEAIADRAFVLIQEHAQLGIQHAIPWATAQINSSVYVSVDFPLPAAPDPTVYVPYRSTEKRRKSGAIHRESVA